MRNPRHFHIAALALAALLVALVAIGCGGSDSSEPASTSAPRDRAEGRSRLRSGSASKNRGWTCLPLQPEARVSRPRAKEGRRLAAAYQEEGERLPAGSRAGVTPSSAPRSKSAGSTRPSGRVVAQGEAPSSRTGFRSSRSACAATATPSRTQTRQETGRFSIPIRSTSRTRSSKRPAGSAKTG